MKHIRQKHGYALRVILFSRLLTLEIDAGYVRFA